MKRIAALLFVLLAVSQPLTAAAQPRNPRGGGGGYDQPYGQPQGRGGQRGGGGGGGQTISMEQAVAIVSRRMPGRLLDASPMGANYRVVWLTTDGRRIDFVIDAGTGAILSGG
jgi:uncharacterized membrane protein YkoI